MSDRIDAILDDTPIETRVSILIEMGVIGIISDCGYKSGPWTDKDDDTLRIIVDGAEKLSEMVIDAIKDD